MNLNRIYISLKTKKGCLLNYNYNYSLLKQIYKSLSDFDKEKGEFLHNKGFEIDNKKFKLFNPLFIFTNSKFSKEGIQLAEDEEISLLISGEEKLLNSILSSLIKMNTIEVCNCLFEVTGFNNDKDIKKFNKTMLYKVLHPVVESKWDGKIEYLSPYQVNEFFAALAQNLKRKYKLIYNEDYEEELYFDIENWLSIKEKRIRDIKGNGYKKGYGKFNIWIEANPKMQKIAYYLGLGQNNTLGAGTLMYLTGR